ncbi:hypothetical protein ABEF95_016734 [Exophiala dermatitidis]
MDYCFTGSPSQSPHQSFFTAGQYFDSTSESSSPNSPHVSKARFLLEDERTDWLQHTSRMKFDDASMTYNIIQYGTTPSNFYSPISTSRNSAQYDNGNALDQPERGKRRSGSTSTGAKGKDQITSMHVRRRAQNRASQRAFRERKEKHLKGLEHQLEDLHEKHQDLLQSYTRQADEVTKLNNRIAELTTELGTLRSCQDQSFSEMLIPDKFDKFDAFGAHDMLYNRSDSYADATALDFDSEFPLDSLGGSL